MKPINVLSIPSYHPSISKLNDGRNIIFINPNTNLFDKREFDLNTIEKTYPPASYDIVHVHFEYQLTSIHNLRKLLTYFKRINKPIVWTWHDKRNLTKKDNTYQYEKLLFTSADKIIAPTYGMKKWILQNFSEHKNAIDIIPLGNVMPPYYLKELQSNQKKNKKLFTILIGDFRPSKEYIHSLLDFLSLTELSDAQLQVIYRPSTIQDTTSKPTLKKIANFMKIIKHPRIYVIAKNQISDREMAKLFYKSHAIILPYLWGTHSAQIELAKDVGCYAVVSDVGFYNEQDSEIILYNNLEKNKTAGMNSYQKALLSAYQQKPRRVNAKERFQTWNEVGNAHVALYKKLLLEKQHTTNIIMQ